MTEAVSPRSLDSPGPRSQTRAMGRGVRPSWFALCLLALIFLPACKKTPPPLATVSRLRLSPAGITQHPWLGLSQEELLGRARASMQAGGAIVFRKEGKEGAESDWKAVLEITHVRALPSGPGEAGSRAEVGALISLERDGERFRSDAIGEHHFAPHDPQIRTEAFRRALDGALEEASRLLVLQLTSARKSEAELIADLASDDADLRDLAIRILTERKSAAAVDHLIPRLDDEDRNVQLRTIGALVEIGDPSAVPALVEATAQRDPGFVVQVAYALGEFGDEEAEAFLFTASTGHPEPAVRRAATEALENLRRRRAASQQQP